VSDTSSSGSRAKYGLSPLYVAAWAALAAIALAYLALMVVRPEIADGLFLRVPGGSPEDNRGQRAMAQLAAEIRDLKQTVRHLETEITDLRTAATAAERSSASLAARLSVVENGLKSVTGPMSSLDKQNKTAAPAVAGFVEERAAARPVDPSRTAIASVAGTGRVAALPSGRQSAVQLASAPSVDALRLSWQLVQEGHKSVVRGLEARYLETSGDPTVYKLVAGPVATDDEAGKLCERLRTRNVSCTVVPFSGKPL
jgi:outer membrane murein-binding lipoprotein Lpp